MRENHYETVIGLEVHAQLLTRSKLFCADSTAFGQEANTQVSAVSLGHPGTLPRLNKEAVRLAITLGLATDCEIVRTNYFARKNYFYPDLPKGYQISQHTTPICKAGGVKIQTAAGESTIRLNRIHIEEDAGKSLHDDESPFTRLDYNRAGVALVEIVTEPDLRSAEEAAAFVSTLRQLVRHLGVCDGNMEEGSLRCDVNLSVRKKGDEKLGTKVEVKNLNSIRFIRKAVEWESAQLIQKLERGETILQQTKGFNEATGTTYVIRTKEDEDDYRYFPDPDLPPFIVTDEMLQSIQAQMPPLPAALKQKLKDEFELSEYDAVQLSGNLELANYYLALVNHTDLFKPAANWVLGPVKAIAADSEEDLQTVLPPAALAPLLQLVNNGTLGYGTATQQVLPQLLREPQLNLNEYIRAEGLQQQSGSETDAYIEEALRRHAEKITEYRKGKKGLLSLFVGEVMKLSKGKANAAEVNRKLAERLNNKE